jgi:hypothetical protein
LFKPVFKSPINGFSGKSAKSIVFFKLFVFSGKNYFHASVASGAAEWPALQARDCGTNGISANLINGFSG